MLQHDNLGTPSSVDAKTAEEALSLALRLQQERGERVTLEELQKTADEAGIDRVYLEGALRQVAQKAQQQEQEAQIAPYARRRVLVMGMGFSVAVLVAVVGRASPTMAKSPFFFLAVLALVFGALMSQRVLVSGRPSLLQRRFRRP